MFLVGSYNVNLRQNSALNFQLTNYGLRFFAVASTYILFKQCCSKMLTSIWNSCLPDIFIESFMVPRAMIHLTAS